MRSGISRTVAVAVVIVVILIIAGGAYYATTLGKGTTTSSTSSVVSTTSTPTTSMGSSTSSSSSSVSSSSSSSASSSGGPQTGGTLTFDVSVDKGPPADPMTAQLGGITGTVMNEVYEGLTAITPNGNLVPDLAVNWTQKSSTDFVFGLRQGVLFQDGTQFNASSVVFTFNRFLDNPTTVRHGEVADIANVTMLGPYQVEFKLHNASSDFLTELGTAEGIVSPTAVAKYGSQFGSQAGVGTGPYSFVQWVQNDHVTLQANPNYWGPKPYIQTIIIKVVPDASVRALQLQSGQAQIVELSPQEAQRLSNQSSVNIVIGPPREFITISMNLNKNYTISPLLNPLVRQAINYAINRSAIVQYVMLGYAKPGIGPIPPAIVNAFNTSLQVYPFDGNATKAKQLLAQAGYPNGFSASILTGAFTPDFLPVTEAVAANLQAVGINATVDQQSFNNAATQLLSGNQSWSLSFHDWGGVGVPTANGLVGQFYNPADIGYFNWNLQHINDSVLAGDINQLAAATPSQVPALSSQIQARILSQAYGAILYYPDVLAGTTLNVKNFGIAANPWFGYTLFNPVIGSGVWLSSTTSSSVGLTPIAMLESMISFSTILGSFLATVCALVSKFSFKNGLRYLSASRF